MTGLQQIRLHASSLFKTLYIAWNNNSLPSFILVSVFGLAVYFNIRVVLNSDFSFILGEKKDFTIIFLYLSDILIISLFVRILFNLNTKYGLNKRSSCDNAPWFLLLIAIISFLAHWNNLTLPILSVFYLLYIAKLIVLHETVKSISIGLKSLIIQIIWIFGLFESFITILQFSFQQPLGLRLLNEPVFSPYAWEIAKVEALGQVFVRPYGTFSHPNVLSAFLLLSLTAGFYFYYMRKNSSKLSWGYLLLLQINLLALFMSFSRAAWLATAIAFALIHVFTWNIFGKEKLKLLKASLVTSFALGCIVLLIFQPFVKQRGNVFDKAYQERKNYNQAAVKMIVASPVFGLGPGESVLHMEQYLGFGLKPWEIQPIHNYYLLLAAEIGLPALVIFLIYLCRLLRKSLRIVRTSDKPRAFMQAILVSGLISCLVLMLFDHYFYTIQATAILFWVWLGLVASCDSLKKTT